MRGASGEPRLAACVADPGLISLWEPMQKMFGRAPAGSAGEPGAADPTLFEPYTWAHINASPAMRWKVVQRAFWVHGIDSLADYLAIARDYSNREALRSIRCPVFVAWEEDDPLAASAQEVYDALNGAKTLVRFLAAEGAGDHCAILARSLFHQRMFDWLDEALGGRARG